MSKPNPHCLALVVLGLATAAAPGLRPARAEEPSIAPVAAADAQAWKAVAPGRVEPVSQQIRLGSLDAGRIGQIEVNVDDHVFAGEALVRIANDEIETRLAKIEAEVNLRKRARPNPALPKDAPRRQVEDAEADAAQAVIDAQTALDRLAATRGAGDASEDALKAADVGLSTARTEWRQKRDELAHFEAASPSVGPTEMEGQLAAARIDLSGAHAAFDDLTIRAPIAGTILLLGAKVGELASPASAAPLVVLGDLTALRVRAELDEREYGTIKTGEVVVVRSDAFPGRDFTGKVLSIAPLIAPGTLGARGQSNVGDVDVAEVMIDLKDSEALIVGMKVDVYFRR